MIVLVRVCIYGAASHELACVVAADLLSFSGCLSLRLIDSVRWDKITEESTRVLGDPEPF